MLYNNSTCLRIWPGSLMLQVSSHSVRKESICHAGNPSSIPGSGRPAEEGIGYPFQYSWASQVAQLVKNLPAMWETWVQDLGWEDPLEKGKATHSSILAWRIPWTVVHGVAKSRTWLRDFHFQFQSCPVSFLLSLLPFSSQYTMVILSFFLFSEHGIFLSLKQQKKPVSNLSELHPPLLKSE